MSEHYLPLLPTAPLAVVIREQCRHIPGGQRELAQRYADRYGGSPWNAQRNLWRIFHGVHPVVRTHTADRWLTLLGLHLDIVYVDKEVG